MNSNKAVANHLANSPGVYVIRTDLNGNFTYVNPYFEQRFGFLTASFPGTPLADVFTENDRPKLQKTLQACREKPGMVVPARLHSPRLEGGHSLSYCEFSAIPGTENNLPEGFLCIGFDISGQQENQQNPQDLQFSLNDIWEQAGIPVIFVKNDLTIERVNRSCLEFFTQLKEPVILNPNSSLAELFPVQEDPLQPALDKALTQFESSLITLYAPQLSSWLRMLVYPTPAGCTLYCFDETEARTNKQKVQDLDNKLRAALAYQQTAFLYLGPDFRIKAFSKATADAVRRYFGRELYEGMNYLDILLPEYHDAFTTNFNRALEGKVISHERQIPVEKDVKAWYLVTYYPVFNIDQDIAGVAFTAVNIDSLKKQSQLAIKQQETLEKISLIQSHQVRGPVATLLGLCRLIDRSTLEKETKMYFELIEKSCLRLDQTIHDIVDNIVVNRSGD